MAMMILEIELPGNRAVTLEGARAKYWTGEGLPTYEGEIAGLPADVIEALIKIGAIKAR